MANARETPDENSIVAFTKALSTHSTVAAVERRPGTFLLDVTLKDQRKMAVYMTNIYAVGEADVVEIQAANPDVNCVVTLSSWNMTTSDAVQYGRDRQIGVFTWKEFFGAIHYRKFWLYEKLPVGIDPAKAGIERNRRRSAWN